MKQTATLPAGLEALFEDFDPAAWPVVAVSNQGIVVRVARGDLDLVVKAPRGRGLVWRARAFSLRREHRAYRRLAGLDGFARCLGLFGDCYLVLEHIDGAPLRAAEPADPETFFQRLRQAIEAMHARGVAHGDLKSRHNVMVTSDDRPVIIDLGTAVVRKSGWPHLFNRWLFNYLCRIDLNGWVKLKYGRYDRVDDSDRHLVRRTRIERANNWVRRRFP